MWDFLYKNVKKSIRMRYPLFIGTKKIQWVFSRSINERMRDWSDGFSRKTFLFQFIRPGLAHFGKSDLLCQNRICIWILQGLTNPKYWCLLRSLTVIAVLCILHTYFFLHHCMIWKCKCVYFNKLYYFYLHVNFKKGMYIQNVVKSEVFCLHRRNW